MSHKEHPASTLEGWKAIHYRVVSFDAKCRLCCIDLPQAANAGERESERKWSISSSAMEVTSCQVSSR